MKNNGFMLVGPNEILRVDPKTGIVFTSVVAYEQFLASLKGSK